MKIRILALPFLVALIATVGFAGDHFAGDHFAGDHFAGDQGVTGIDRFAADGWSKVADGVFQRVEQGGLHRVSVGLEGLQWDIARIEALLDATATRDGMTPAERKERLKVLADTLLKLRDLELVMADAETSASETKVLCTPQTAVAFAQSTPYSGAGIHGAFSKVEFNGSNCPAMYGEGHVFAFAEGSATGIDTDYEEASWSTSFEIIAHAMGVYQICDYGTAFLHWINNADQHFYLADSYESPQYCYCPNCS